MPDPPLNPRREAYERLGGRYDARVLEPSPAAVAQPPWFADDPTDPEADRVLGLPVVSPVSGADLIWDQLADEDPALAPWCADRWLGAYRRLVAPPPELAQTRASWHRLAEHVIAPARQRANGKIGLRFTRDGFGTPFFGADVQVRMAGDMLCVQTPAGVSSGRPTSLKEAAVLIREAIGGPDLERDDQRLDIDPPASAFIGDWFGFAASVLEQLRAESTDEAEPSRVQLWPEHFDMALELGSEAGGSRAAYGCSPGDELHPEPYVYVAPWKPPRPGELWQATGFTGAQLDYRSLVASGDQRAAALKFLRVRVAALQGS